MKLTDWGLNKMAAISQKIFSKCKFLIENFHIAIKISLNFVAKGPIGNMSALVQVMAWHHQVPSHYLNQWWPSFFMWLSSLGVLSILPSPWPIEPVVLGQPQDIRVLLSSEHSECAWLLLLLGTDTPERTGTAAANRNNLMIGDLPYRLQFRSIKP